MKREAESAQFFAGAGGGLHSKSPQERREERIAALTLATRMDPAVAVEPSDFVWGGRGGSSSASSIHDGSPVVGAVEEEEVPAIAIALCCHQLCTFDTFSGEEPHCYLLATHKSVNFHSPWRPSPVV